MKLLTLDTHGCLWGVGKLIKGLILVR